MSGGWTRIGDTCQREAHSRFAVYGNQGKVVLGLPDANNLRIEMTPAGARELGAELLKRANEILPPAPVEIDFRDEDPGTCTRCGQRFELVRPGKSQPTCSCWQHVDQIPEGPQG